MSEEKIEKALSRSFYYEGTKLPKPMHGCMPCVSAAAKLCMQHQTRVDGCPMCAAARGGICSAHGRGLKGALDEHEAALKGENAKSEWQSDRAYIEAKTACMPDDARIKVHAHGYSGIVDAHPRLSAIEVIQQKG